MAKKAAKQSSAFHCFTEADWAAIEQTLPAQRSLWARDIRFELEQIGREFWGMRQQRLRRPSARDHKRLRRCIKMLACLESSVLKNDLAFVYRRLMGWDALLEMYSSEGFQRKRDVHREVLYARIIALWESSLGGRFGVSSTGPLARFLDATLNPILGPEEMLGLDGIKAVLQREKNRREYAIGEARRLEEKYGAVGDWVRIGISALLIMGLRGIEWANLGSEGVRKLCIS
jgi:hypothetical protein